MTPLTTLAMATCVAIGPASDQGLLRDIAPAFGASEGLPLDSVIALAPAPGVERRFEIAELRHIAARLKIPDPQREICISRPVAALDGTRVMGALRSQFPAARIELLDFTRQLLPEGVLEFPRSGLRQTPGGAVWSGSLQYGGRRRLAVWARVNITVSEPRVVAVEDLPSGALIDSSVLRLEIREEIPSTEAFAASIDEAAGKTLRRPVRAGTAIRSAWLQAARAVLRGDAVRVESQEGAALVQAPGVAQASGSIGETILVLNSMSHKRFPARVTGKGKVTVGKGSL